MIVAVGPESFCEDAEPERVDAGETTPTPKMLSLAIHTLATSMRGE